jgi:hypothetical protein
MTKMQEDSIKQAKEQALAKEQQRIKNEEMKAA